MRLPVYQKEADTAKQSEGLKFNSSWELRIFFFVPRSWQDEKTSPSLYFFTELKTYHLSYFYLKTLRYRRCWS